MTIEDWRVRIDEIDETLVGLLNDRTKCAIEIAGIKRQTNTAVVDPEREREVIRNIERENRGPLDDEGLRRIFKCIIDEMRRIERQASQQE